MSRAGDVLRTVPMTLVIGVVASGIAMVVADKWRWGLYVVGGGLVLGALLRLLLPVRQVGGLAVRSRFVDVLTLTVFGSAVLVLAAIVPSPNPG
ncbi:MAG TPA: DUF3017 domain-containing protein [Mycobacteriales bacterium]|nr:DUF3017 domain-containing protein [Mycobacteriales bacterium]